MTQIKHNDYIRLTINYLRDFVYDKGAVETLASRITELKETLADVSTKIAGYEQPQGGSGELSAVEAEASKRINDEQLLNYYEKSLRKMRYHLFRIEKALELLGEEDRQAIELHYQNRMNYKEMAPVMNWSPRTCKRRVGESTKVIAYMLFGDKAKEDIYFVC